MIKTPILSFDGDDAMVFETVRAAERFVEPPDVDDGVTYDAEGRLLGFETDGRRTVLSEREPTPSHGEALRTAIANALAAAGSPTDPTTPLEELVEIAVSQFRV